MQYLIKDFGTEATPIEPPSLRIVDDNSTLPNSLWHELEKARDMRQKIVVYKLPDSVLDWS